MRAREDSRISPKRTVSLAVCLLLVLAGSLALRLVNEGPLHEARASEPVPKDPLRWTGGAPTGQVPPPPTASAEALGFPHWAGRRTEPPIAFQTDLDRIAPLGDGPENAALWFADFARPAGARLEELDESKKRLDEPGPGWKNRLLPDDPLLLEAEPWVDQATMRFYPDVWEFDGWDTPIPNLLMMLDLARTWSARADERDDLDAALADYRRAIRLGRLLRQDDVTIISDLVGLACIRIGLEGMYDRYLDAGDLEHALLVSLSLGEIAPQRLKTSEAITRSDVSRYVRSGWLGEAVDVPDEHVEVLAGIAQGHSGRRFRIEAILNLNLIRFEGPRSQRNEAAAVLDELAGSDDPVIAAAADWARTHRPDLDRFVDSR